MFEAERALVVAAHPDDETIGCGAQLGSGGVHLVIVTDGAPRDLADARAQGFSCAADYAEARRSELDTALRLAGMPADRLHWLGVPDQQAAQAISQIARDLARLLADLPIEVAVTHAYEGGHPDHDATCLAVHAVVALQARRIPILEMPYYRADGAGIAYQRFAGGDAGVTIHLSPESRALKQRMLAAYETQRATLLPFSAGEERFRRAPAYDFAILPNDGALLYERYGWGLTGADWLRLAPAALQAIGLRRGAC